MSSKNVKKRKIGCTIVLGNVNVKYLSRIRYDCEISTSPLEEQVPITLRKLVMIITDKESDICSFDFKKLIKILSFVIHR